MTNVSTASVSNQAQPTFLVDVLLKKDVRVQGVTITVGTIAAEQGINCLIGMDIITLGDLSITNYAGKTIFSFRIPAQNEVDFVEKSNREMSFS